MKRCNKWFRQIGKLWVIPVFLVVALLFFTALHGLQSGQNEEGRRQLEESLRRAAVTCYATEGIYPPTISYLEDRYGVQIDRTRYGVFYEVFAENLMPNITVVELE